MKKKLSLLILSMILMQLSCKKEETEVVLTIPQERSDPEMEEAPYSIPEVTDQVFRTLEVISSEIPIGIVKATDEDGDVLSYEITTINSVFKIDFTGTITLLEGEKLDFETLSEHSLTISVSDGQSSVLADIIIEVIDIDETASGSIPFIATWRMEKDSQDMWIPISYSEDLEYDYSVDWGDGNTETNFTGPANHTYEKKGDYKVTVTGKFPTFNIEESIDFDPYETYPAIIEINQWGNIEWETMYGSFFRCTNLRILAQDAPNLFMVTNMAQMFERSGISNSDLSNWDVSTVTNMSGLFSRTNFNGNISTWDVGNVVNMKSMFYNSNFNGDLTGWDVSSVKTMESMFASGLFNGDISSWNVSSVTNMSRMFDWAISFNQDLTDWNVSSVTDMSKMFSNAEAFNGDLNNWDVSAVFDMSLMFENAVSFNSNLNNWNLGSVTDMAFMFRQALSFRGDLSSWDVSTVINMHNMFDHARSFNSDLSNWDVRSVKNISGMFDRSGLSIVNYESTLEGWSELSPIPSSLVLGAEGMRYCDEGEAVRAILIDNGWTFNGDSRSDSCD